MVKDIRHLPRDLRKLVTEARAEAAAEIHESLQNRSPYWTGTFAESWVVSPTEVQATKPRMGDLDKDGARDKLDRPPSFIFRQISQESKRVYQALTSPVFIGNQTDYAAFVINKRNTLEMEVCIKIYLIWELIQLQDLMFLIGMMFTRRVKKYSKIWIRDLR